MIRADQQRLDSWLQAERIAYIEVRSAARAVLSVLPVGNIAGPVPFHYVLYGDANRLLWWGKRRPATLRLMARWQELFGPGFTACFGQFAEGEGAPRFQDMDGVAVDVLAMLGKGATSQGARPESTEEHADHSSAAERSHKPAQGSDVHQQSLFPACMEPPRRQRG